MFEMALAGETHGNALLVGLAEPFSSALRIESSSRTEPPGCTMAVTPYPAASATQSSKGKKPSDASTIPSVTPAARA